MSRRRLALLLLVTLALGVASRRVSLGVSLWDKSLGDVLYAVAMFLALALVRPRAAPWRLAAVTLAGCTAIELFQLTGVPLALARAQPWTRWILGTTFAWHDLGCYVAGSAAALVVSRRVGAGGDQGAGGSG